MTFSIQRKDGTSFVMEISRWNDPRLTDKICDMVNAIYVDAEEGIWRRDKKRIEPQELQEKLKTGDVFLAQVGDDVVGTVYGVCENENLYRFEMLSVDPKIREGGIGSKLVEHIEQTAIEKGCHEIQFELLHPKSWLHEGKERMKEWYTKRGYKMIRLAPIEEFYPQSLKYLITDADFSVWSKLI